MLVLTRKENEIIQIDAPGHAPIEVVVLAVGQGRVRLGIRAAADVTIVRGEIPPLPPELAETKRRARATRMRAAG